MNQTIKRKGPPLITKRVLLAAGLICLLMACAEESPSPVIQVKARPTEPDPEVRKEGNKTIITTAAGDELVFGPSEGIPPDFPQDLPVYPGIKLNNHVTIRGFLFTTFSVEVSIDEVKSYFTEETTLSDHGWTLENTKEGRNGLTIEIVKEDRRCKISLAAIPNSTGTNISYVTPMQQ